ncbi:reverse transcriptase domain-containing protein [Tanacetum coccineum]
MILDRGVTYAHRAWAGSEDRSAAIEAHSPRMSQLRMAAAISIVSFVDILYSLLSFMGYSQLVGCVAAALTERDADRSRNGDDSHDSGTGERRQVSTVRGCTYNDFLKCQPMNFKGTEGVVGLTQWLEKMESVFHISNSTVVCQVKCATCTLQGNALTWWNSHVRAVGHDVAYAMPWKTLKKLMTDKYGPRGEIKKLETKMWNLKVKGTDVMSYNQRFQELVLMCDRMCPEELGVVEKYVGGLPDMIHGSVKASKPKTMQEAIEFATELMDKKILSITERRAKNKRKNRTKESTLYAPNATIAMMGRVLPSALTTKGLAIWPVTVKVSLLLPTTTKDPKGQTKEFSLAMSVELRVVSGVIAQS